MGFNNLVVLNKHDVTLKPLDESDLEMVRTWRNSDFVRRFMFSQDDISAEEHKKWFFKLKDNERKYSFIISDEVGAYGVCSLNMDFDELGNLYAEGGVYSADESKLNSLTPIKAMCILYDWAFSHHKVSVIKAKIRSDNKRAIRFNQGLGFQIDQVTDSVTYATLTKEAFNNRYNKIKRTLG